MTGQRRTANLNPPGRFFLRVVAGAAAAAVFAAAFAGAALFTAVEARAVDGGTEIKGRATLLVCSAPDNLPYSNRAGEGFENKIAELVAAELGIPLTYAWFSQSLGPRFVRDTLNARRCDLIVGISAAHELLLNTNPYYSSAFALVYRADADFELASLSDKVLKDRELRIGLIGGAPPTGLLLENGLITQMVSYRPVTNTGTELPSERILKDVLAGNLDVAVLWGPVAGWLNRRNGSRFKVVPMAADNSDEHRMVFRITMGVRSGEIQWKRELNKLIRKNQEKINAILAEYNVPLVEQ